MKTPLFVPAGPFMLRTPLLGIEDFLKISNSKDVHTLVEHYYQDPLIKEAIYIASQDLVSSLEKKERKEQTLSSLLKYLLRMSTRATPFGLFSTVAVGELSEATDISLNNETEIKKRIRPDMEWLTHVIDQIEQELETVKHLKILSNPLSYRSAGRVYLENRGLTKETKKETLSIRASYLTDFILGNAKEPILYQELCETTYEAYPHLDKDKMNHLIWNLFQKKFLITELTPSLLTSSPFQTLLDRLAVPLQQKPIFKELMHVSEKIQAYNKTAPGEGLEILEVLVKKMRDIKESPHSFQVDAVISQNNLKINHKVAEGIGEAMEILFGLFPQKKIDYLESYHRRFLDKYGTAELVPIRQLIDDCQGLGLTITENQEEKIAISKEFQAYIKRKFLEAMRKNEKEIVLSDDLPELSDHEKMQAPLSFEVFCEIISASQSQVDDGNYLAVLHSATGAGQGGGTFGRFTDILGDKGQKVMTDLFKQEQDLEPHACFAESSYLPFNPRSANVAIHENFRDYEINLNYPSDQVEKHLKLDDIYVGANLERLYLVSKRLNKELNVNFANMLNPVFAPPVLRFMRDITKQKYRNISLWDWGHLREFTFLPRVRYKNTILSVASWKLHLDGLNCKNIKEENRLLDALHKWIEEWDVPRYVYMTWLDNKILLDLQNAYHLKELLHELKSKKGVLLTERVDIEKSDWIKSHRKSHLCEFVIPFIKNKNFSRQNKLSFPHSFDQIDLKAKVRTPGSDWLYAKLFVPKERQEEFIAQKLAPFAEEMIAEKFAKCWFFIRYVEDPDKHHIRIRFHGDPSILSQHLLPRLHDWSLQLISDGYLRNLELGTYEREIQRYGGLNLIDAAECVFAADSLASALLLRDYSESKYGMPLYALGAANIINMLDCLGFSLADKIKHFEQISIDRKYLEGFKTHAPAILGLLKEDNHVSELKKDWLTCLEPRFLELEQFGKLLKQELNDQPMHHLHVIQSLIHMHCNRLMGADHEKEKKALSFAQSILIKLKHVKQETLVN